MAKLLEGRVAVITGAGRGLGREHALLMAKHGAKVVVNDLGGTTGGVGAAKAPADEVVEEIKKAGGVAVANYDSVADSKAAQRIIKTATDNFGRLDILVNNAGILRDRMTFNMTDEEWDIVLKVHLYGTFYCTRDACVLMREQRYGRIITTSSTSGLGNMGQANYSAAKEGIVGFTRTVAIDMSRYGVTCNSIRPGAATRLTMSPELFQAWVRSYGQEQAEARKKAFEVRTPVYVSPLVVFLTTEQAGNLNGCVFEVNYDTVALYTDPPRLSRIIRKKELMWQPEELVELGPKTLGEGLPSMESRRRIVMPDAKAWEWSAKTKRLKEVSAAIPSVFGTEP